MLTPRLVPLLTIASLSMAGCATTGSSSAPAVPMIGYILPSTVATASGTITIEDCDGGPKFSGTLLLGAEGRPDGPRVQISAAQLDSLRFRRQLEVQRHPNGTIASVNSAVEDRLPRIIGSIFSSAAQIATSVLAPRAAPGDAACTADALSAVARLRDLRSAAADIRENLRTGNGDSEDLVRRLDAVLAERAAIRQNRLTATFKVELPVRIEPTQSGVEPSDRHVPLHLADALERLVTNAAAARVTLRVTPPTRPASAPVEYQCARAGSLCLPSPHPETATWNVQLRHASVVLASGEVSAPMPQWSPTVELPLRVGFAGNRTFAATYDAFGRQVTARWGSEARGATAAEAIAGYVGTATGLADELRGPTDVERQKAEIEELETRQRLNRLRACQEILAAGGSACPAEASPRPQ